MKRVILIRHAKSDWKTASETDFERPLNKRGLRDLPAMADRLKLFLQQEIGNDFNEQCCMIYSPAKRTEMTASALIQRLELNPAQTHAEPSLYEASLTDALSTLQTTPCPYPNLLVVGHNPGLEDLVNYLSSESVPQFPTSAVAVLEAPIDHWHELSSAALDLLWYDFPKLHQPDVVNAQEC